MLRRFLGSVVLVSAAFVGGHALSADALRPIVTVTQPSYDVMFGLYGGAGTIKADDPSYRIFGLEGALNMRWGTHGLYIDGREETGAEASFDTYGGTQAGAHLYFGLPGGHTLGVFGAFSSDQDDDDWNFHGLFGAEAAFRHDGGGLGVQGGWIRTLQTEEAGRLGDAWFVRAVGQVFGGSGFKLQGEVAYLSGRGGCCVFLDDFHMMTAGVELEFKFHPRMSTFLSWDGQWLTDETASFHVQTNQILAGVRFRLNDMGGMDAPLNTPNIVRWNAVVAENLP